MTKTVHIEWQLCSGWLKHLSTALQLRHHCSTSPPTLYKLRVPILLKPREIYPLFPSHGSR